MRLIKLILPVSVALSATLIAQTPPDFTPDPPDLENPTEAPPDLDPGDAPDIDVGDIPNVGGAPKLWSSVVWGHPFKVRIFPM